MRFEVIHIAETDSTNRYLRELKAAGDVVVWTDYQTAGRGCGTNTWESERGRNLLFSVLIHPEGVRAADQFILSMANALALRDALAALTDGIRIKWPNDIYWHDRKLCGTLIECSLSGPFVKDCIIGTGINVNQQQFLSDAPNPVSLRQILGHDVDAAQLLAQVTDNFSRYMEDVRQGQWERVRTLYRRHLYRLHEVHRFRFTDGSEAHCQLLNVSDDGHLLLLRPGGQVSAMAFKEVQFII